MLYRTPVVILTLLPLKGGPMKKLLISTLLTLSATAQAEIIARYDLTPGYTPRPVQRALLLEHTGKVTQTSKDLRTGAVQSEEVLTLSKTTLRKVQEYIHHVSDAKLIDEQEGQPMCYDTPTVQVSVKKGTAMKVVSKNFRCHVFKLADDTQIQIVDVMKSLVTLAK